MLNIFYFTHLHTKMNPFLHKNSPQCHYFYWGCKPFYCAVIKHGSFSDIVSLNTICPSTVFSITHLGKQPQKREKVSFQPKKTGYDIVQWWWCNRSQTLIKGHNEQVPEGNHIQPAFLQLRAPLISIKINLFTVHLWTFTPFIRDSWWQLKWLNHPAKPIFSLLAH